MVYKKNFTAWVLAKLEELFAIDVRSLALFRVSLALLLLCDLVVRAGDLVMFYTDFGVMPRAVYVSQFMPANYFSVHIVSGQIWFQVLLFLLAGMAALGLLFGYRTRFMTVVSWFLLVSLQNRMPAVLHLGDTLFRMLLFWSMFLPLGAAYSFDRAVAGVEKIAVGRVERVLSAATVAVLLQLVFLYVFAALHKTGEAWRVSGNAVFMALSGDIYATAFGQWLRTWPAEILQAMTFGVYWFELVGPFILFVPVFLPYLRLLIVAGFVAMQVGFAASLAIGIFPWISTVALIVFLPSLFWDKLEKWLHVNKKLSVKVYYDGDCGFCGKMVQVLRTFLFLPNLVCQPAQDNQAVLARMRQENSWVVAVGRVYLTGFKGFTAVCAQSPLWWPVAVILRQWPLRVFGEGVYRFVAWHRAFFGRFFTGLSQRPLRLRAGIISNVIVVFVLIFVFLWNLNTLENSRIRMVDSWQALAEGFRLDQDWTMFAPQPLTSDGWLVIPARLNDGREFDLLTGRAVNYDEPALVSAHFPNMRWRKYFQTLWSVRHANYRIHFARYLCWAWDSQHKDEKRLDNFEIVKMKEVTRADGKIPNPEPVVLLQHDCFDDMWNSH